VWWRTHWELEEHIENMMGTHWELEGNIVGIHQEPGKNEKNPPPPHPKLKMKKSKAP